jgi:LuxR family maltose regulon positive regulatory protein
LERLQSAAQERGWAGILVEILVLKALAQQVQDDLPASLIPLHQALTLAESEGYVRLFVDEGPSMMQLLLEAASHGILPGYTGKLLAAFETQSQRNESVYPISAPPMTHSLIEPEASSSKNSLIQPLSQRELEILRLFRTELSGP